MPNERTLTVGGDATRRPRDTQQAVMRGLQQACPACGKDGLFASYLKVVEKCPECGQELHHHRADDAPPYFTMLIVGHIVVGGVLWMEKAYEPQMWAHIAVWLPLTFVMSLLLLPRVKGALVGLQWALRMHGFDERGKDPSLPDPIEVANRKS